MEGRADLGVAQVEAEVELAHIASLQNQTRTERNDVRQMLALKDAGCRPGRSEAELTNITALQRQKGIDKWHGFSPAAAAAGGSSRQQGCQQQQRQQ